MANFAGQFGRLCAVKSPFTIVRCLTKPSAHNLSGLFRAGVASSCLHNAASRTKICQTLSKSTFLSTRSNANVFESFRFCHTLRNMHLKGPTPRLLFGPGLRYSTSRTAHRKGFLSFFGMKAALLQGRRLISSGQRDAWKQRNRSGMLYATALVILVVGFSYAAVPLYTVFCQVTSPYMFLTSPFSICINVFYIKDCFTFQYALESFILVLFHKPFILFIVTQATGLGGQITQGHNIDLVEDMVPVRGRPISIRFNADTAASMQWNFRPQQLEIKVRMKEGSSAQFLFHRRC